MTWTIHKSIPTIPVPDLGAGIEFYRRLGFALDWKYPDPAPTHAGLMLGSTSIMLSECNPFERCEVYFIVDDVDACHAAILAAEPWTLVEAAAALAKMDDCPPRQALVAPEAPVDKPYGLRDFAVIDPWGNWMSFGQELEA